MRNHKECPSRKILVVEDDEHVRDVTRRILKMKGYDVTTASNGALALQELDKDIFDIIVTDLMMPVIDGVELIRVLRNERKSNIPIIVMTGSGMDRIDALTFSGLSSVTKPYEMEDLLAVVARAHRD